MLVNKKKNSKKNTGRKNESYEENIQSMRSWIRKIEQTTNSIGSRLAAVEKRLSNKRSNVSNNSLSGLTIIEGPIEKVLSELKDETETRNMDYVLRIVDNELALIHDEIDSQQSDVDSLNIKINDLTKLITQLNEDIKKIRDIETRFLTDFRVRLEKIENRTPPVMKLGRMEIPIEISGVIAGVIALLAAFFVMIKQNSILVSPVFLTLIGCVFIGSALLKSFKT
ncbi:MAG: hypothetical protein DRM98_01700 [Thermoplasmata archaeon]|nr:MAG: hypothetical protein DRM98_01700 [Thermoplasmata archaeon]